MTVDPKLIRARYTGIYAAVQWRSLRYTLMCTLLTVGVALVASLWIVPLAVPTILAVLPLPVAIAGLFAALFVTVGVLPSIVQIAVTPNEERRAFEAWNAFALMDRQRWIDTTGIAPRGFRSPERGLEWVEKHPEVDPLQRVRLLLWAGQFDAAAAELRNWPEAGMWPALREQLRALSEYLQGGTGDLGVARAQLRRLPPAGGDYACIGLAIEEARRLHVEAHPWWPPLAEVRARLSSLPRGASIPARLVSGLRIGAVAIVLGGLLGFALSLR